MPGPDGERLEDDKAEFNEENREPVGAAADEAAVDSGEKSQQASDVPRVQPDPRKWSTPGKVHPDGAREHPAEGSS
ncbi:hypothetical protein ACVWWH_000779 [Sinomonas sp. RB5]